MSFNLKAGTARDSRGHFRPLTPWERTQVTRYRRRAQNRALAQHARAAQQSTNAARMRAVAGQAG